MNPRALPLGIVELVAAENFDCLVVAVFATAVFAAEPGLGERRLPGAFGKTVIIGRSRLIVLTCLWPFDSFGDRFLGGNNLRHKRQRERSGIIFARRLARRREGRRERGGSRLNLFRRRWQPRRGPTRLRRCEFDGWLFSVPHRFRFGRYRLRRAPFGRAFSRDVADLRLCRNAAGGARVFRRRRDRARALHRCRCLVVPGSGIRLDIGGRRESVVLFRFAVGGLVTHGCRSRHRDRFGQRLFNRDA